MLLPGSAGGDRDSEAFQGQRASYVAAAAIGTLSVALLCSLWEPDISGAIAMLGVMAVYMCSTELLLLYIVFAPASILVDFARTGRIGYGLLSVVLLLTGIIFKVVGSLFAFSIYQTVTGASYAPVSSGLPTHASGGPPATYASDPFAIYHPPPGNIAASPPGNGSPQSFIPVSTPGSQPAPTSASLLH